MPKIYTYQNVFISPDLSPKEMAFNKILHQELRHCKEVGEANLIIRCGKITSCFKSRYCNDGQFYK